MEIHRQGANRKEGWTRLKARKSKAQIFGLAPAIPSPGTSITGSAPVLTLLHRKRKDPSASGEYDYVTEIELSEFADLLEMLATTGLREFGDSLSEALAGSARSLSRLTAAACGVTVTDEKKKG